MAQRGGKVHAILYQMFVAVYKKRRFHLNVKAGSCR